VAERQSACGQGGSIGISSAQAGQTVSEASTVRMRPEWQECFLTPGEGSSGGIRNGPHAVKLAGLAFREFRGGQTVAKAASIFMRSKWQECPFVSPEEGRRWPNRNGPHAAKVAGVAFCDPQGRADGGGSCHGPTRPEWQGPDML
jgi:hypothetical protein